MKNRAVGGTFPSPTFTHSEPQTASDLPAGKEYFPTDHRSQDHGGRIPRAFL